jgi:TPR repeat protein
MKTRVIHYFLIFALSYGLAAQAGNYEDAMNSYDIGDFAQAVKILHPIAEKGDQRAQYNLGQMYERGKGVNQDYQEALRWYHHSAVQGNARAQYSLGQMYEKGLGTDKDYVRAMIWYGLAANQGFHVAESNRDYLTQRMTPAQISQAQELAEECEKSNYQDCE